MLPEDYAQPKVWIFVWILTSPPFIQPPTPDNLQALGFRPAAAALAICCQSWRATCNICRRSSLRGDPQHERASPLLGLFPPLERRGVKCDDHAAARRPGDRVTSTGHGISASSRRLTLSRSAFTFTSIRKHFNRWRKPLRSNSTVFRPQRTWMER